MAYNFEPEKYQVVDRERGFSIKSIHTGAGMGWRGLFYFVSPEVEFFFFAKIVSDDPKPGNELADHWSLDGLARRASKDYPLPIKVPQPLLSESFREISEALKEIRFSGFGFSKHGEPIRKVEFDLNIGKPKQAS